MMSRKFCFREDRGNMLILTTLIMFGLVMIIVQFSSFIAMLVAHQRLQDEVESFDLRAVNVLNEYDRTGRINLLTAASRELVFESRQIDSRIAEVKPQYQTLANFYLDQSRQGAEDVSTERERILSSTLSELRGLAADINKRNQTKFLLPWASMQSVSVLDLDVGYTRDEESNVEAPLGNPGLLLVDEEKKLFDKDTKLYYGNIKLKLPAPDDDLDFKLAGLPAPVSGTVPQARIDEGRDFMKTLTLIHNKESDPGRCQYLPSTAKITFVRQFQNSLGVTCQKTIAASVAGTANGANPPPI
jgi:hypothetical protein